MKNVSIKFLLALALLVLILTPSVQAAFPDSVNVCIYTSSVTMVSGTRNLTNAKYVYSVIIASGIPTALTTNDLVLYDSANTTVAGKRQLCAPISLVIPGQYYLLQSCKLGVTYVSSGTAGVPITIIYREK